MPERQAGNIPNLNESPEQRGNKWLLVIGIDQYEHHEHLKKAVADAEGFAKVMTIRYGFKHLIEPLYNEAATRRNILEALSLCEKLGEHDRLIVFYAGHGWYKPNTQVGYIVPTKANTNPHADFIATSSITDIFKGVEAKHILLIVDCCFGGSFGNYRGVNVEETMNTVNNLDIHRSRWVLSSGGIEPVKDSLVFENNSPFMTPLLDILNSNKLPSIVLSNLFPALREKTNWTTKQMPQYKRFQNLPHDDGELGLYCTDLQSDEELACEAAIKADDITQYEDFLYEDKFTNSTFKSDITRRLKEKRALNAWKRIENSDKIEDFMGFVQTYFNTPCVDLANNKIEELKRIRLKKRQVEEAERQKKAGLKRKQAEAEKQALKTKAEEEKKQKAALIREKEEAHLAEQQELLRLEKTEGQKQLWQQDAEEQKKDKERLAKEKIEEEIKAKQKQEEARQVRIRTTGDGFFGGLGSGTVMTLVYLWIFDFAFEGHEDTYKYIFFGSTIIVFAISRALYKYYEFNDESKSSNWAFLAYLYIPLIIIIFTVYSGCNKPNLKQSISSTSANVLTKNQNLDVSSASADSENVQQKQAEKEIVEGKKAYYDADYTKSFTLIYKHKDNRVFYGEAPNYLGAMYELGKGVKQDYAQAINWYQKAAEIGNVAAQFNLALIYENGKGGKKNVNEAVRLYRLAAKQGDIYSKEALKRLGYPE
jgi:Caspase domain/Sel1 repeat